MSNKTKVKFLCDVEILDHKGDVEFSAKSGEKVELINTSAERWIRRGKASDDLKAKTHAENKAQQDKDNAAK